MQAAEYNALLSAQEAAIQSLRDGATNTAVTEAVHKVRAEEECLLSY